jgi:hypothetical protein
MILKTYYPSLSIELCQNVSATGYLSDPRVGCHHQAYILRFAYLILESPYLALGLEGSANKLGAGVIKHSEDGSVAVLSNIRHTYITPPGEGFQPRDTALHHREWVLKVINECLITARVSIREVNCICYTKGISVPPFFNPSVHLLYRTWHGCPPPVCRTCCPDVIPFVWKASGRGQSLHRA